MSSETELKFRIPPARLAAVRRAVSTRSARVQPLAAVYFDTSDEHLAQARVALRLRREGETWVQTLKAEGASAMHRLEHNVTVVGAGQPDLVLSRHEGTEAGRALFALMAKAGNPPLQARYATDVQRTQRVLRLGSARVELALDEGRITADGRSLPVCELEFELLTGTPQALLELAGRWVDRFGLVLDMRSKSERGHLLAAGVPASPPTKSRPVRLVADATPAQALGAMLSNALGQALANASVLADPDLTEAVVRDAEYLHQLRVGLRRLRSLLRVYGLLAPSADAGLAQALAALFGQLGAARDQDAMAEWLWPALQAAEAPWVPEPDRLAAVAGDGRLDITALLGAPATQRLWLSALAACQTPPATPPGSVAASAADALADPAAMAATPPPQPPPPGKGAAPLDSPRDRQRKRQRETQRESLRESVRAPLHRLMRQVQRDAVRFSALDDDARHRLRRRIKRLRYAADAAGALWPAKSVGSTLRALARAQEPLGAYNDTVVALGLFRALATQDSRAWFVVGWLTARRDALAAPCARALGRLARLRGFWRRR